MSQTAKHEHVLMWTWERGVVVCTECGTRLRLDGPSDVRDKLTKAWTAWVTRDD